MVPKALVGSTRKDGMRSSARQGCAPLHTALKGGDARLELGNHTPADKRLSQRLLRFRKGHLGDKRRRVVTLFQDAHHVGDADVLLRPERGCDGAGHDVGVDVVSAPVKAEADGGYDRDVPLVYHDIDDVGVNRLHLADVAEVHDLTARFRLLGVLPGTDAVRVLARKPDGLAAQVGDACHYLLVYLPRKHHLHKLDGLGVGDAKPGEELRLLSHHLHEAIDLWAAPVYDDGLDARLLEEEDVLGKGFLEGVVHHGVAPVLDDNDLVVVAHKVWNGLDKDIRPLLN
jgi:hypothetical protein